MLYLFFVGVAIANDGLLDLQGRIFGDLEPTGHQRRDKRPSSLTKEQRGLWVNVNKDDFDDRLIWLVLGN